MALCVTSHSQECCSSYDSRWGCGGERHRQSASHLNADTVAPCVPLPPPPPPVWSLDCIHCHKEYLLFSVLLNSCRVCRGENGCVLWWMALDPWNLLERGCIYISQISRTHSFTSGESGWHEYSLLLRCRKWRLNICYRYTSAMAGGLHQVPFCYMINFCNQQL